MKTTQTTDLKIAKSNNVTYYYRSIKGSKAGRGIVRQENDGEIEWLCSVSGKKDALKLLAIKGCQMLVE
jgi:hypothetical protein